jgi:magnesium chelatase family protein
MLSRYRARISGPLIDRFDLVVRVGRVESGEYGGSAGEPSAVIAERVLNARRLQRERGLINRSLTPSTDLEESPAALAMVSSALGSGILTARGADRVRRVARTIADLEASARVEEMHMAEAVGLRGEWRDE